MKRIITLAAITCLMVSGAYAQSSFTSLQYSMGFGMGDVGKFISPVSFRGATFEWRKFIQPNLAAGLEAGWNVFYEEKSSDTYTLGTASITGKQFRYQNQVPLLAAVDYYLMPGEKFNPFIGLGIGTMYSRRNTDMNQYTIEEEAWHFALRPEIGFLYELRPGSSALVALKYYNGFQAGDFNEAQSYLTLNVGFAFTR